MRVGFNGLGRMGVYTPYGMMGLGDTCTDPQSGEPYDCSGASAPTPCVSDGSCSTVPGQTTDNCGNLCPDTSTSGSGTTASGGASGTGSRTCWALAPDGTCASWTADGGATTTPCGTSTVPPCSLSASQVTAAGGAKAPTAPSTFSSILSSLFGTPSTVPTNASACTAAKGTWNGTTCVPAGSLSIGGMAISTTTLLIGGALLLLVMKGKR